MQDHETITDQSQRSAKELLREQRKAQYQKAKALRKAEKKREQGEKALLKKQIQEKRDSELWEMLKPASECDAEKEDSSTAGENP